jgi:hypothetical protein
VQYGLGEEARKRPVALFNEGRRLALLYANLLQKFVLAFRDLSLCDLQRLNKPLQVVGQRVG